MGSGTAVLLDIDGVLVVSWEPVPGAAEVVARVRSAGRPLRFLTNTTSVTAAVIRERLQAAGIDAAPEEILTAGVATAEHLRQACAGARCLLLNDGPREDLAGAGVTWVEDADDAEVVVIGGAGPQLDWDTMNGVLRALLRGAGLVAMHGSRTWQTTDGACLDGGAYVAMLELVTGTTATVVGKPAPAMFEAALRTIGCEPGDAVMVGDDVASDVLAAQALGITGVLVRTGKFRPADLERDDGAPDHVVDSVADLPDLLDLDGTAG